jgi:hypothetical protein
VTRGVEGIDFWKYVEAVCKKASTDGIPALTPPAAASDPEQQRRLDREHNQRELARLRAARATDPIQGATT